MPAPGTDTPSASEQEIQEIWATFDTFSQTAGDGHVHPYPDCDYLAGKDPREKDVAVFPPGFKPVCSACLKRWRRDSG